MRWIVLTVLVVGCNIPQPWNPQPEPIPQGVAYPVLCLTAAALSDGERPTPNPRPDDPDTPDAVPTPANCPDNCNNGVLGDGRVVFDCGTCDSNGDGDPDDPVPRQLVTQTVVESWGVGPSLTADDDSYYLVQLTDTVTCQPCILFNNYRTENPLPECEGVTTRVVDFGTETLPGEDEESWRVAISKMDSEWKPGDKLANVTQPSFVVVQRGKVVWKATFNEIAKMQLDATQAKAFPWLNSLSEYLRTFLENV